MSEAKDPAIKLFGTTIPVVAPSPTRIADAGDAEVEAADTEPVVSAVEAQKDASEGVTNVEVDDVLATEADEEDEDEPIGSSGLTSSHKDEVDKTSIADEKTAAEGKSEDTKTETDCSTPEKVLKKPDKILPCPRCKSMDTKFCYYNNYNVNQPRHFCKNCQRYWTAGGTMRNVPVGAGRRKSKHSVASQCRSLVIPSTGLQSAQPDTPNSTHHQRALPCVPTSPARPLIGNGTILRFGQEVPLCESVASVLGVRGEQGETADSGSAICGDNREEPCCASSDMERSGVQVYCNGLATWAYSWRPTWNDVAAMEAHSCRPENGDWRSVPWGAGAVMAATLPFPLMAAPPFWGFTAWPNGTWNVSSKGNRGCSGNDSPTLGKHSRDSNSESEEETMEKCLWVPKTLRIDDPEEAAKSSIWAALGIKPDMGGTIFQSKVEKRAKKSDAARILHANPAALSRFESFQEST